MRETVYYAEVTCDICKKTTRCEPSREIPRGWSKISLGDIKMDICYECKKRLVDIIIAEQKKYEKQNDD